MLRTDCEPFSIVLPNVITLKGYTKHSQLPTPLYFEWRYMADALDMRHPVWRWLPQLQRSGTLGRITDAFGFTEEDVVSPGDPSARHAACIPEWLVTTKALVGLLCHCAMCTSLRRASKRRALNALHNICRLCSECFESNSILEGTVRIHIPCKGQASACLVMNRGGRVVGLTDVASFFPTLGVVWSELRGATNTCLDSPMDKAKLFDVLQLLLQCKVSRKPSEQELHFGFGRRVLPLVVGVIAYSFEVWTWEIYLREHGALKPLPRLKSLRTDPTENLFLLDQVQRKPGCASGIALVVTDSESRMVRLQRAHSFLHLDRVRVSFAAAKHFSLAWDPSNYGGEHTMVTALYSWQPDLAAILHPKVTRCQ